LPDKYAGLAILKVQQARPPARAFFIGAKVRSVVSSELVQANDQRTSDERPISDVIGDEGLREV
jgi:hypothetical protein